MVLHFGKTCFCLIILPQKKTLQFTLFSVATSVFGVFFVKHQEKQNLDYGCFFISFRFGRTFFECKKKKVLNKRQNDKKKNLHDKEHFYLSSVHEIIVSCCLDSGLLRKQLVLGLVK